jgi:hypothetical protein
MAIATRKSRSVQKELQDTNWMHSLFHLSMAAQLSQFVVLWAALQEVELQHHPDAISWR